MKRKDDQNNQVCFRTDRMFEDSGRWYFKARNSTVIGPFKDALEASTQLEVYIRMVASGLMPDDVLFPQASRAIRDTG